VTDEITPKVRPLHWGLFRLSWIVSPNPDSASSRHSYGRVQRLPRHPYSSAKLAFFSPASTLCRGSLTCSADNDRFRPLYTPALLCQYHASTGQGVEQDGSDGKLRSRQHRLDSCFGQTSCIGLIPVRCSRKPMPISRRTLACNGAFCWFKTSVP
jgi:hypothetical protein